MRTYVTDALREKQIEDDMKRGIAASESGDKTAAEVIFREIVNSAPHALEAWVWLGWTSKDLDQAESAFRQAAVLDPKNEEAQLGLRWIASRREEMAQGEGAMAGATTQPTSPTMTFSETTNMPTKTTNPSLSGTATATEPGLTAQTDALETAPSGEWNADAMMEQGIAAAQAGDKPGAYKLFKEVSERHPNSADVLVWLAGTCPTLEEAEEVFRRAAEIDPTNEGASLGLRWVALRRQALRGDAEGDTNQMPKTAGPSPAVEEKEEAAKLSFFARLLKKFNIPLPAMLLVVAVVIVYAVLIVWLLMTMQ
jgi:tetratricopeptide (TPR) repeat protein